MTHIFIAYAAAEQTGANQLAQDLPTAGYTAELGNLAAPTGSMIPFRASEQAIRKSAAVVVLWSASSAAAHLVQQQIAFATQLHKPLILAQMDATAIPATLANSPHCLSAPDGSDLLPRLHLVLPAAGGDDRTRLLDQLTHDQISIRKAGIQQAALLLQRGLYGDEIRALLADLVQADPMPGEKAAAQKVLAAHPAQPLRSTPPNDSIHIVSSRCATCGCTNSLDKRYVCPATSTIKRSSVLRGGRQRDTIYFKCTQCEAELQVEVDCEGYK